MQEIVKQAEDSVKRVLKFYEARGTALSYQPTLQYHDGICQQRPDAVAMVKYEYLTLDNVLDFFSQKLAKTIWKDAYNLDISSEAIAEITRIQKKTFGKILLPQEFEFGADILIFQPYQTLSRAPKDRDEIIAHEVWHLIEQERGLQEHPFIMEGTATYAMKKFVGQSCDKGPEDYGDFFMMMYLGAANIVQSYVGDSENPYQLMLDRELRAQMQNDLLVRVEPVFVESVKKLLENEEQRKAVAHTLQQIPELQSLEGDLTPEGIYQAYSEMGATILVDELKGQDLEGLMYWFRMAGF